MVIKINILKFSINYIYSESSDVCLDFVSNSLVAVVVNVHDVVLVVLLQLGIAEGFEVGGEVYIL